MKKNITINIKDKNNTKSEIIYDNVVDTMEKMQLNKGEQIEYLKTKITQIEQDQRKKYELTINSLICLFSLIIGITFLILNFYTIGIIIIFTSVAYTIFKTYNIANKNNKLEIDKYEEIEAIRKIINDKLK